MRDSALLTYDHLLIRIDFALLNKRLVIKADSLNGNWHENRQA